MGIIEHFKPGQEPNLFLGQVGVLETVAEEKVETICHREKLPQVLEALKARSSENCSNIEKATD